MFYVINRKGEEKGPFDIAKLKQFADAGRIHPGTRVRKTDFDRSNSARRIRGLFSDEAIAAYEASLAESAQEKDPAPHSPPAVPPVVSDPITKDPIQSTVVTEVTSPEFTPALELPTKSSIKTSPSSKRIEQSEKTGAQEVPIKQLSQRKSWMVLSGGAELGPFSTRDLPGYG